MKKKAVCWGIGSTGRHVYSMNKDTYDILCFVDNDTRNYTEGGGGIRSKDMSSGSLEAD